VVTQLPSVPQATLRWLCNLVQGTRPEEKVPLGRARTLVGGSVNGFLLGGNLSVLTSLVGTPFFPELSGAILFIEDTGEEAYRLDRLFAQLKYSGVLKNVFGVVMGSLARCKPSGRNRFSARKVLEDAVAELGVPAISGADFGHIGRNVALPLGVLARLDAGARTLTLLETGVGASRRP
jgi:muramoyltetrapeptide carboxypeptidase